MIEVCWNGVAGPIPANVLTAGGWQALDRDGRDVLPDSTIYANDETGEIWAFATQGGKAFLANGELLVMRTRLGAGAFTLSQKGA